jgi:hypothetical protein
VSSLSVTWELKARVSTGFGARNVRYVAALLDSKSLIKILRYEVGDRTKKEWIAFIRLPEFQFYVEQVHTFFWKLVGRSRLTAYARTQRNQKNERFMICATSCEQALAWIKFSQCIEDFIKKLMPAFVAEGIHMGLRLASYVGNSTSSLFRKLNKRPKRK